MPIPETMLYQGVTVDIVFGERRPHFGDLFPIAGESHPGFPPTGSFAFDKLAGLQFEQVDDYFGVRSLAESGDDVAVWLYPLVKGVPVEHHPGPFDALRLSFCVLRNPARHADHYLKCVGAFGSVGVSTLYRERDLGVPPDLSAVREDIDAITQYWASRGIEVGSEAALMVDY